MRSVMVRLLLLGSFALWACAGQGSGPKVIVPDGGQEQAVESVVEVFLDETLVEPEPKEAPGEVSDAEEADLLAEGEARVCECEDDSDCEAPGPCQVAVCDCTCKVVAAQDDVKCDDKNPCTEGDRCVGGQCVGANNVCPCEKDEDCASKEDGDLCNGTLFCDKAHFPYACNVDPKTVVKCEGVPDSPCLVRGCDPATGQCVDVPTKDGEPCDNGNACEYAKQCKGGACVGVPVVCDDGNPCTDDGCAPEKGCVFAPNSAPCDDGDPCTLGDRCEDGACTGADALLCDDGNECTTDVCVPGKGCEFQNADGELCEDGDLCTEGDVCLGGQCKAGKAVSCDDGNPCTDDWCESLAGCAHGWNEAPCEDGDPCTVDDRCMHGACMSGGANPCDDHDACTRDWCDGGCRHEPVVLCDDNDSCTVDSCDKGTGECAHARRDCDDKDLCTVDVCKPMEGDVVCEHVAKDCDDGIEASDDFCDPGTGECVHICEAKDPCTLGKLVEGQCVFEQKSCDDQDACTVDSCDPVTGNCLHVTPLCTDCDDHDVCTVEWCDPATGEWLHLPNQSCDDSDRCTWDVCEHFVGCKFIPVDCSDNNPNTLDFCDNMTGECKHILVSCDDFDPCTKDILDPDTQTCKHLPDDCNDLDACTVDHCEAGVGCVHTPIACPVCTDPCMDYRCDPATGLFVAVPLDCEDGDLCTVDSCNPAAGGCVHVPIVCNDGNLCTTDVCDKGQCRFEPVVCSDGRFCNGFERCDPGTGKCIPGVPPTCDDGVACTVDSCDPASDSCVHLWAPDAYDGPANDPSCFDGRDGDCDGLADGVDPDCFFDIYAIDPARVPVGLVPTLVIEGAGFGSAAAIRSVKVGAQEVSIISVEPTRIKVALPLLDVGRYDVTVRKAHVEVKKAGALVIEGLNSKIAWGNFQWPQIVLVDEGSGSEKVYGQVYQPGLTPGGDPGAILAQVCVGPVGTLPWKTLGWECEDATFNQVPPSNPNNFEYMADIGPLPGGYYDAYFRYSLDGGVNWLYGDLNGSDDGCTPEQAAKVSVVGQPGPGDIVLNEVMWMGTNDISKGPADKWVELRNMTSKPFRVRGLVLAGANTGTPPGDVVLGATDHVVNTEELKPGGLLLVVRQGASDTAVASKPDVIAPDLALPSPNQSYPSRTYVLKSKNGVVLDVAVARADDTAHLGENGANGGMGDDRAMERNDVPGDGSVATNWHTASRQCRPQGAWKGVDPDNGHNFGSPGLPNCAP